MLEDIAILTGGEAIFKDLGIELENVELTDLGRAKKVTIDNENTTIVEGAGTTKRSRPASSRSAARSTTTTSDYDREKLQERLAKLAGGVAQINVGAATETEMKEKKARVEDALHATRAAVEEGILPGGGVALIRALKSALDRLKAEGDEAIGVDIVRRAVSCPAATSPRTPASRAPSSSRRSPRARAPSASTPKRRVRATWSRPASSTRPRSPAPRCRTPSASPAAPHHRLPDRRPPEGRGRDGPAAPEWTRWAAWAVWAAMAGMGGMGGMM